MEIATEVLVEYLASTLAQAHFTHHIELEINFVGATDGKDWRELFFSFSHLSSHYNDHFVLYSYKRLMERLDSWDIIFD